jgi:preprotein translocase subunit YajC
MIDTAYAMAGSGGQGPTDMNSFLVSMLPMILIFGVFYFLLIRPQQKKAKEHKTMLDSLKKGDSVITNGGLFGKINAITDQVVTLEIAKDVRVRVARGSISGPAPTGSDNS